MTKDMTEGAIPPLLIGFTIPLVLGNLFQLLYNAVDSMIVGKFVGETALAAVGTSSPLITLAILFISGMCMGAGVLMGMHYGAKDYDVLERQISSTMIGGRLHFSDTVASPVDKNAGGSASDCHGVPPHYFLRTDLHVHL